MLCFGLTLTLFLVKDPPSSLSELAREENRGVAELPALITLFLLDQLSFEHDYDFHDLDGGRWENVLQQNCIYVDKISIHNSITVRFISPTDPDGRRGGELKEIIRVNPSYRGHARFDCVLVETDEDKPSMLGLHVAQALLAFSLRVNGKIFPCVLDRKSVV